MHLYKSSLSANSNHSPPTTPLSIRIVVRRCADSDVVHLLPVLARVLGQLRPVADHPYLSEFLDGDEGIDAIVIIEDPSTFDTLPHLAIGYWAESLPTFQMSGYVIHIGPEMAIVFIGTKDQHSDIPIYVG